ncbi:MAG: hypothetical protein KKE02_05615 [Alphaproteobacteria bacterium]|nr:hypothetical protein [Alphaproteobacteria bacterium]MBU1513913.1 hypothetical protein [Alphaproteobacteria bacterium]MBU2094179.1 hypothetical protein [Alphaproteobacteria bacterium]MBU2150477.1 hypothetical protein [Alphaproteobacteria bacterium]MBU2307669.1 hypothetical protein [Alphaproteobacteria bacterium]
MSESPDLDGQDGAEAYDALLDDESGLGEERTFEELPQVEDLTQLDGDRDEDEALALDADEFDPDAIDDNDTEEDHELDYRAGAAEREDDLDGQGPEDGFDEARVAASDIDGLDESGDALSVEGGEDDVTNFESKSVDDADLRDLGYAKPKP